MPESSAKSTGGCLCGGVRYEVDVPLRDVVTCHCSQCRRTSGHYVAATGAPTEHVKLLSDSTLSWYSSSAQARRGFCNRCGGNLFWRPADDSGSWTSIMAGTLDMPTGLHTTEHIFVADKSDYYQLDDELPQHATWPEQRKA
ncbi:MAG: GFA family protein [Sinobacteraceae bacterium]|nr:GFA family protein [Nevskiaceae bacterium]MBV9913645.1 GFA family protein [Nevskiaceae bacterium]